MASPRVSIIMATYNCHATLPRCIDSILAQTFQDWEFIICDDCSTDASIEVLMEYADRYPGKIIVLKNKQNSKLAFSLNRCLEVAKGEYIARMDGDDTSLPERLERQVAFLDTHPEYAVVGCGMIPFDGHKTGTPRFNIEVPQPRDMLNRNPFAHATILMRRSAYVAVNGYTVCKRTNRAQDYDMWFRFFKAGLKGYNMQEPLYQVLEDDAAYKRRSLQTRLYEVVTKLKGYRMLGFPFYLYIYAFKPALVALLPDRLMKAYHLSKGK